MDFGWKVRQSFFRESVKNFSKGAKSCGSWSNQASFQNIGNVKGIDFSENIRKEKLPKKNFLGIFFFILHLGLENAPGCCIYHYSDSIAKSC